MGNVTWPYATLNTLCQDAFCEFGFTGQESGIITDVLLMPDLYGIEATECNAWCATTKALKKV